MNMVQKAQMSHFFPFIIYLYITNPYMARNNTYILFYLNIFALPALQQRNVTVWLGSWVT